MQRLLFISQRETVLSALAVATMFEYGWNLMAFTESTWPLNECLHLPAFISNIFPRWSIPALAKKSPVSWISISHTDCVWSLKVWVQAVFVKSQIFTVQSPLLVKMWRPFGWNLTELIHYLCPSPDIISSPCGIVHNFQDKSSLTVARIGFLGCSASPDIAISCPLNVLNRMVFLY